MPVSTKSLSILLQQQLSRISQYFRVMCHRVAQLETQAELPGNKEMKHLIMGDSILGRINKKGPKNNVEVIHYPRAKIDTVCDKIKLFNLTDFRNVVTYLGGNNAMNSLVRGKTRSVD